MALTIDEVNTIVTWSVIGAVILTLFILACVVCCIQSGCCGPFGLERGDVRALKVFNDIYRFNEIEVIDGYFDTEVSSKYCRLRRFVRPANPATSWASLKVGASKGFLVEVGREIDRKLLEFQHSLWLEKGDHVVHYPVFMVAQEWREWVMDQFQHIEFPDYQHKKMIEQRVAWINDAREVGRCEIVELRYATGWDESDEISLLQTLRDVGRDLRAVYDRWHYYVLQQGFSRQAEIITGFMIQLIRCGVRFLHKLLSQDELRIKDDSDTLGAPHAGVWCCVKLNKWYAHSLYKEIRKWTDDVNLWDPTFPVGYLARFFADDKLTEIEANIDHLIRKPAASPFAPWNEDILSNEEKQVADNVLHGLKPEEFGLEESAFRVMVQRSVTLFTEIKCITECAMVLQTLQTFSGLGGTLFLTNTLGSQHVVEVMEFICRRIKALENDVIAIGDRAEAGWSYLRRNGVSSIWSNESPVDNARLGLRVRSDIHRIVKEIEFWARSVQSETANASELKQADIEEEITSEIQLYERLWQIISTRFDKKRKERIVHVHDWHQADDHVDEHHDGAIEFRAL